VADFTPADIGQRTRALVVGLGSSGFAAARLLKKIGAKVTATDSSAREKIDNRTLKWLDAHGIDLECGPHSDRCFKEADLIVVSPGVPLTIPVLREARDRGVVIIGEMALAAGLVAAPVLAVTGTNGKSTVTELLGKMFRTAGKKAFVGGNLGTPLSEYLLGLEEADLLILEVSSFQLDSAPAFRPALGILLNISPDHLDRYENYAAYAASKFSLFSNQKSSDLAILNYDDPEIRMRLDEAFLSGRIYSYGHEKYPGKGAAIAGQTITLTGVPGLPGENYNLAGGYFAREPNIHNAAAAILAARLMECPAEAIRKALAGFEPLGHRLEFVGEVAGVTYLDDSKATNIGAVQAALEGQKQPVILIGGGRDKGGDYTLLAGVVREKVKGMVLLGEAREAMAKAFGGLVKVKQVETMSEAVETASEMASPGDLVLLSPACASFDMFDSYAHRGRVFREAVKSLQKQV